MATSESTRNLLLANVTTAVVALVMRWPLETLLWPYWIQSVVIGWYSRRRILLLGKYSTAALADDLPNAEATSPRWSANFFSIHYGLFHLFYLGFLMSRPGTLMLWDRLALIVTATSFVVTHRASFKRNIAEDAAGRPDEGMLMLLPYARVVPMHLAIILGTNAGATSVVGLLIFVSLKTGADILMHHVEHRLLRRNAQLCVDGESSSEETSKKPD